MGGVISSGELSAGMSNREFDVLVYRLVEVALARAKTPKEREWVEAFAGAEDDWGKFHALSVERFWETDAERRFWAQCARALAEMIRTEELVAKDEPDGWQTGAIHAAIELARIAESGVREAAPRSWSFGLGAARHDGD